MSHFYNIDGDLCMPWERGALPSPSTILDRIKSGSWEALIRRKGLEEADRIMTTASARGTRVHKACELWLAHGDYEAAVIDSELLEEEEGYLAGFIAWWTEEAPTLLDSELVVISHKYRYAGRLDLVVLIDGTTWIVDIKTGQDSVRHGLQLKFYQQAYAEGHALKPSQIRMGVLALDPSRAAGYRHSKQPYGLKEYREPLAAMLHHIAVFRWWNKKQPGVKPSSVEDVFGD